MLWVVDNGRPVSDAGVTIAALWVGGLLGAVAIPLYAFGYRRAALIVAPAASATARVITLAGATTALVGAVIHALTAWHIFSSPQAPGSDPLTAVTDTPLLLALWIIAGVSALAASILIARAAWRSQQRLVAMLNPALVSAVVAVIGTTVPSLRAYLAPAAPNVAHLVFFVACGLSAAAASSTRRA